MAVGKLNSMGSRCTRLSNYMGGWCPRKLNSIGGWVKKRCCLPPPGVFFWNSPYYKYLKYKKNIFNLEIKTVLYLKYNHINGLVVHVV